MLKEFLDGCTSLISKEAGLTVTADHVYVIVVQNRCSNSEFYEDIRLTFSSDVSIIVTHYISVPQSYQDQKLIGYHNSR